MTDSPEATKERQRLFREDWQREMAEDAMTRGGDDEVVSSTTADITGKIEEMQKQNANVFAIPDYFVYMSRAFATLEGIGLSADPDYAILQECFPYLAKRLLSDDSPRARRAAHAALRPGRGAQPRAAAEGHAGPRVVHDLHGVGGLLHGRERRRPHRRARADRGGAARGGRQLRAVPRAARGRSRAAAAAAAARSG